MINEIELFTAQELEKLLGNKYFYRQSIYRMADSEKVNSYDTGNARYFSKNEVINVALERLVKRIERRHPWIPLETLGVRYDENQGKRIVIYGFSRGEEIVTNTDEETEGDLIRKIEEIRKEVIYMPDVPVKPHAGPHDRHHPPRHHHGPSHRPPHHEEILEVLKGIEDRLSRIEEKLS